MLTHGPLAVLGIAPSHEAVKVLAEGTLVLVLFSDASRVGLRDLQAELGLCLRLLGDWAAAHDWPGHRVRLTGERCSPARPVTVAAGTSPMEGDAGQWRRL